MNIPNRTNITTPSEKNDILSIVKPFNHLLIVDDEEFNRTAIRRFMQEQLKGYALEISGANDGLSGLEVLNEARFNGKDISIILSDTNMLYCGGLKFASKVRAIKAYASLPFLLMSSACVDREDWKSAGVTEFISKLDEDFYGNLKNLLTKYLK